MHRLNSIAWALGLGLLAGAGCLAAPADCSAVDCTREEAGLLPTVGLAEEAQLHGCAGGFTIVQAAWDPVRKLVPEAFDVQGYTSATALLYVQNLWCERIVTNASIYSDVALTKVAVFVTPTNDSWGVDVTDYYILDLYVSDAGLAGAPIFDLPMADATISRPTVSLGADTLETWTVKASVCQLDIEHRRSGETGEERHGVYRNWAGQEPFRPFEDRMTYRYQGGVQMGLLRTDGSCASAQAMGKAAAHMAHAYAVDSVWSLSLQGFAS